MKILTIGQGLLLLECNSMQTTESYPSQILNAVTKIEPTLPVLVGETSWQQLNTQVNQTLTSLRNTVDPNQQAALALELIDLFSHYPAADRRLHQVLNATSEEQLAFTAYLHTQIKPVLLKFASQEGGTHTEVEQVLTQLLESTSAWRDEDNTREVVLSQGGVGGAKLIGMNYLDIDFYNVGAFLSGAILTGDGIIHNPWLIPFGLLITIAQLRDIATTELDKEEATVLWGLMHAAGRPDNKVPEYFVIEATNRERQRFGLHALSEEEVYSSLNLLKRLGIAACDEEAKQWRFVERVKIVK